MKLIAMRYFLIRDPNSLLSRSDISPVDEILDVFFDRTLVIYYGKSYYAIVSNEKKNDKLIGFLLRSTRTDVIIPDKNEFEKQSIPNWEECFLAIDTVNQTIPVQNIAGSFTPDLVKNVLNKLLEEKAKRYDVSAKVELICRNESFWATYRKASKRYKISITLNAPNLFGAEYKTNQYLKEVQEKTNMDKLTEALESEEGKLSVKEGYLEGVIDYADKGGGHWSQVTEENGIKKTTTSNSAVVKENADITIDTPKGLKERFDYVQTIVTEIFKRHVIKNKSSSKDEFTDNEDI